ncbi:MAG TPA: KTSC domain-containing protein [Burkholderiaceae bacterium]|nr:KTSC domain-containing protein [Burkholderiaceae bacterium]
MQRRPLHTDRLKSAGYDARAQRLEIEFSSGEVRAYAGVPDEVARRFFAAPNPAAFWEDRIAEEYPAERAAADVDADARAKLDALFGRK